MRYLSGKQVIFKIYKMIFYSSPSSAVTLNSWETTVHW